MPVGERPGSFEGQREWRSVGAPQQTVYQNVGGFVRFELEPRRSGKLHRQFDAAGSAVDPVQVEGDRCGLAGNLPVPVDGCDQAFA